MAPELQARAPQPYSTGSVNRGHARADLGAKLAAFSERMRREQAPPAPAYVLSHMTQPAPAPTAEPAPATPQQPLFVLSHMTQPAPAPAAEPAPATPPQPQPQFVLNHTSQTHAPQQPLYYLNHNPNPVYADPFARANRHSYFAGRMTNLLTGLPNRFLPRRRRNGGV
ncbi:hypothetical protein [Massilia sp. Root335]|uniref:hypothetical protein n=1 Tax=Massilia sp. Root335 TaxID=1736517 RepID=UPI0006F314FF|nr:hypothetical protein [Massilia sp. Root335]KQV52345.1 hypothetical protein ASC93_07005 [Massilia sp. Root335]